MMSAVKSLCQIIENSSNMHFLVNRFQYSICYSESSIFSRYLFIKTMLYCYQFVTMKMMTSSTVHSFLKYLRKTQLMMKQAYIFSHQFCLLSWKVAGLPHLKDSQEKYPTTIAILKMVLDTRNPKWWNFELPHKHKLHYTYWIIKGKFQTVCNFLTSICIYFHRFPHYTWCCKTCKHIM